MSGVTQGGRRRKTGLPTRFRVETNEYVSAMEVSADGRYCLVGLGDGRVLGVDLTTGRTQFDWKAHSDGVLGLSLSPDAGACVTCGPEPTARVWTIDGRPAGALPGGVDGWVEHVAWAPRGGRIATAAGKKVRLWTARGEPVFETEPMTSAVTALAWRTDGTELAASCYGGVHVLPMTAGSEVRHLEWEGSLISLAWSPDARVVACGSQDGTVHFWRLSSGRDSTISGYLSKPRALAWDRDAQLLATAGAPTITVWDFRGKGPEGTDPVELAAHRALCTRLVFHPRRELLASGDHDGVIHLWEPRRRKRSIAFARLSAEVTALAWTPSGDALIGTDAAGAIGCWDVA